MVAGIHFAGCFLLPCFVDCSRRIQDQHGSTIWKETHFQTKFAGLFMSFFLDVLLPQ